MQHRHLLPNEIDLLLDGEVGFGVAPLRAHVEGCAECAAKLDDARLVVDALDRLPHFAPSAKFTDAVLAQVQIVEPWHVALLDAATRLVPKSRPMRVVMGATALTAATAMSASVMWLAVRADVAFYLFHQGADRARAALLGGIGALIDQAFGQSALEVLRSGGMTGLAMGGMVLLAGIGGATLGLRSLASASRRARE
ncbi:MAG: hypothetical protein HYR75_01545 [Gemmatimonadetes bacterium]|nr:hypothetical protein [Gemmatimonadota bacterium]MBI3566668.1 hypothetical protein [Gemmatimonadota bacterium]